VTHGQIFYCTKATPTTGSIEHLQTGYHQSLVGSICGVWNDRVMDGEGDEKVNDELQYGMKQL